MFRSPGFSFLLVPLVVVSRLGFISMTLTGPLSSSFMDIVCLNHEFICASLLTPLQSSTMLHPMEGAKDIDDQYYLDTSQEAPKVRGMMKNKGGASGEDFAVDVLLQAVHGTRTGPSQMACIQIWPTSFLSQAHAH